MSKKYYWLKLMDNFFDLDHIKIIEGMENGKEYIVFLFKLMLKSVKNGGYLRVTDKIPYNEKILSQATGTNIDIVRSAIQVFMEFDLIEIMADDTIYMNCIESLIGKETDVARRVRKHREKKELLQCNTNETKCNTELEIEKKRIEIDKRKEDNASLDRFQALLDTYPYQCPITGYLLKEKATQAINEIKKRELDLDTLIQHIKLYNEYCIKTKTRQQSIYNFVCNPSVSLESLQTLEKQDNRGSCGKCFFYKYDVNCSTYNSSQQSGFCDMKKSDNYNKRIQGNKTACDMFLTESQVLQGALQ